jgi:hypothetical protein
MLQWRSRHIAWLTWLGALASLAHPAQHEVALDAACRRQFWGAHCRRSHVQMDQRDFRHPLIESFYTVQKTIRSSWHVCRSHVPAYLSRTKHVQLNTTECI